MLQEYDPRNNEIKIYVNGALLSRAKARVSVFDSSVQGGDAVWEGIRVYKGRIFALDDHLQRLMFSAKALDFKEIPTKEHIVSAIMRTLKVNDMDDQTHIRLTLSRGEKITSGMDPRLNQTGCTLIVLAEWKAPVYPESGIKLCTSHVRRNNPQFLDSKIHHNNLLNNILAKIEANYCGADDAIMLDMQGFVSETNASNIFLVKGECVYTSFANSCVPGITRKTVIRICREQGIEFREKDLSISEFYNADEVFTSGSMGELTPVYEIDGRIMKPVEEFIMLKQIREKFMEITEREGTKIE